MSHKYRAPEMQLSLNMISIAFFLLAVMHPACAVDSPVIGVFSRHVYSDLTLPTYIAASYARWIEAAGGRVLRIHSFAKEEEMDEIFKNIHGVLFPGGGGPVTPAAKRMWELAKHANEAGDHFPVWGTCLGLEWMVQLESDMDEMVRTNYFVNILQILYTFFSVIGYFILPFRCFVPLPSRT